MNVERYRFWVRITENQKNKIKHDAKKKGLFLDEYVGQLIEKGLLK